jgi:hypothetical protein
MVYQSCGKWLLGPAIDKFAEVECSGMILAEEAFDKGRPYSLKSPRYKVSASAFDQIILLKGHTV